MRENYERWMNVNNRAISYMFASMSNTLRSKIERKETALEILEVLHEMFGNRSEQARIELTRKYSSAKMKAGTTIRDQVMII